MRKKNVYAAIALLVLCGASFVAFDSLLWRLFGFQYCAAPASLHVSNLETKDNTCHIAVESMTIGSFQTTKYNGLTFTFSDGVLTIGIHKGIMGGKDTIRETIVVDRPIKEVRLCGDGREQILFQE